jgi:catechol 2,3-dioxygenase-like lactoylglutathione lyase family enzyme
VNILGPDSLVFGVEDLDACNKYLSDYGLKKTDSSASGAVWEAADGTNCVVRTAADSALPSPIAPSPNIRETVYGVADKQTLEQIGAELSKDRNVRVDAAGVLHSVDDSGIALGFQVTIRRAYSAPLLGINCPGQPPQRPANVIASDHNMPIIPRTLSHVVYFVPDVVKAEKFYRDRLQFRMVDRFTTAGPFLRPAGTHEHHTLFLIQGHGPMMNGLNHFAFHVSGASELFQAGWQFFQKGYKSFWGPGRHILGSNYFWYFNSPFGGMMEYDADMDLHDDSWVPREVPADKHTSQIFLFDYKDPWSPTRPAD